MFLRERQAKDLVMQQYLLMEESTGVLFQVGAHTEDAALKFASLRRIGHKGHEHLFRAVKVMDLPEGTVARLKIFEDEES